MSKMVLVVNDYVLAHLAVLAGNIGGARQRFANLVILSSLSFPPLLAETAFAEESKISGLKKKHVSITF